MAEGSGIPRFAQPTKSFRFKENYAPAVPTNAQTQAKKLLRRSLKMRPKSSPVRPGVRGPAGVKREPLVAGRPATRQPLTTRQPPASRQPARQPPAGLSTAGVKRPAQPQVDAAPSGAGTLKRKKIPAWDLKARVQQNEELMANMARQLQQMTEKATTGEIAQKELSVKSEVLSTYENEVSQLKNVLSAKCFELDEKTCELEVARGRLLEMEEMRGRLISLKSRAESAEERTEELSQELRHLKKSSQETILQLRLEAKTREETVTEMSRLVVEHEKVRRKLHNDIQELKGNIRVFCRLRPLLSSEASQTSIDQFEFPDIDHKKILLSYTDPSGKPARQDFSFDHVFTSCTTQDDIFQEVDALVQSAMDGFNVCIFAYGQTGSGKTHTMEGPSDWSEHDDTFHQRGLIPRSMEKIFAERDELESAGWKYNMVAQFVEIYNETIHDLLDSATDQPKHEIKLKDSKSTAHVVTNLKQKEVENRQQFYRLLRQAVQNRRVAETNLNKVSSRSHCVFQLMMRGENKLTDEVVSSTVSLIDLAGSERIKDSGSEGQRAKEAMAINSSLTALSNVIMALSKKDKKDKSHVPFRDSKLTYMLQDNLGGSNKTLMFMNLNPRTESISESLNSLRFATKVNNCNIGTATRN